MRTLFLFDLHAIRQDPFATERWTTELFDTLSRDSGRGAWGEIEPLLLLTKHRSSASLPFLAAVPEKVRSELLRFAASWDDGAVEQWVALMRGEGRIAEIYQDLLQWLVVNYHVETFAYWGSNHTIRKFAEAHGLRSVAMELGPTRPPFRETRYCDFAGVNGDAHVSRVEIEKVPVMNLEAWRQSGGIRFDATGAGAESVHRPLTSRFADRIYCSERPCALLVMQLDDDSNCLVHSRYSGMLEMIKEAVPFLTEHGWRVFVKPHPGAAPERNQGRARWRNVSAHRACRNFLETAYGPDGEAVWLDDVPPEEYPGLLAKMDAVISVNSSVGFEAMLLEKPVVALGNAPYNVQGKLPTLKQLVRGGWDRKWYSDYCNRVCSLLLNYYLCSDRLLSSPPELSHAIRRNLILEDAWQSGGSSGLTEAVLRNPLQLIGE